MRRLLPCLLLAALGLGMLPGSTAPARQVVARPAAPAGGEGEHRALLIGVNGYKNLNPLRCCVQDVQALRDVLVQRGFRPGAMRVLTDDAERDADRPIFTNIVGVLDAFAASIDPGDTVFFCFSGHGLRDEAGNDYLTAQDTVPSSLRITAIPVQDVVERLRRRQPANLVLVLDACRDLADARAGAKSSNFGAGAARAVTEDRDARVVLLRSCRPGEVSYEMAEADGVRHGVYTYQLLKALEKPGRVTIGEVQQAVRRGVSDWCVQHNKTPRQTPEMTVTSVDPADVVLFGGGAAVQVEPVRPQPATAALSVASEPAGAEVWVDDRKVGTTPCALTLPAAAGGTPYAVELRLEGYLPAALKVTAQPGATGETGTITLQRRPQIRVEPQRPQPITPPPAVTPSGAEPPPITGKFQTWVNPKDGMEFVFVPAGPFRMGSDGATHDEKPEHTVTLPGYWIGKYEVTVGQFRKFTAATGHESAGGIEQSGKEDNLPVVNVSWKDAVAYCKWAGVRLPTEAEWEKAARGTDGRKFVWGSTWPPPRGAGNFCGKDDGYERTAPVGSFPGDASPYGCLDMAGNVWEWCSSAGKKYPYRADDGREDANDSSPRMYRGGSFVGYSRGDLAAAGRAGRLPGGWDGLLGFRAARSRK